MTESYEDIYEDDDLDDEEGFDSAQEAVADWAERTGYRLDDRQFAALSGLAEEVAQAEGEVVIDDLVDRIVSGAQQQAAQAAQQPYTGPEYYEPRDPDADAQEAWDGEFESGLQRLEGKLGRQLTQAEVERLWEAEPDEGQPDPAATFEHLHPDGDPFSAKARARNSDARRQWIAEGVEEDGIEQPTSEEERETGAYSHLSPLAKRMAEGIEEDAAAAEAGEPVEEEVAS